MNDSVRKLGNRKRTIWLFVLLTLLGWSFHTSPAHGIDAHDILVRGGDAAPDPPGPTNGTFSSFPYGAHLNNAGQILFWSELAGTNGGFQVDDKGLYLESGGTVSQVVRIGQTAPDGNGNFHLNGFPDNIWSLNNAGQALFYANLINTTGGPGVFDKEGLFRTSGGSLIQLAREGQLAPDGFSTIRGISGNFGVLNDSGQTAFTSFAGTYAASFRATELGLTEMARTGFFSIWPSVLNNNGEVAFLYAASAMQIGRTSGGAITQIVLQGQPAPDGNGTYGASGFNPNIAINDSGQVAFSQTLTGTALGTNDDEGIFRGSGGAITQVFREGQNSPGGNGQYAFGIFDRWVLSNTGQVLFTASLNGTSGGTSDDLGLFRGDGITTTQIAREGQPAPNGDGTFVNFSNPAANTAAINTHGQVAFVASLSGGTGSEGIFLSDGIDTIQVARRNQPLAGSTINSLDFARYHTPGNTSSGLNDLAQVAFAAGLADGRQMLVRYTPELHWRTPGSGNWNNSVNWTLGIAPAALYPTAIDMDLTLTVSGPTAINTNVRSFTLGGTGANTNTLLLDSGDLTAAEASTITAAGELVLSNGHVFSAPTLTSAGIISGNGGIVLGIAGAVASSGTVSPGLSAGVFTISGGDYIQDPSGNLEIEIGGTNPPQHDRLNIVGGAASLAGTLSISLIDPAGGGNIFSPSAGDTFEILSATGGVTGSFGEMQIPLLSDLVWDVIYDTPNNRVLLEVLAALEADFDLDGDVDGDDLVIWQASYGVGNGADADNDGDSDGADFLIWQQQNGSTVLSPLVANTNLAVPEPATIALFALGVLGSVALVRRQA